MKPKVITNLLLILYAVKIIIKLLSNVLYVLQYSI